MKILIVLAHPDDEIIFGWPVLQNFKDHEKELIICSNDKYNPDRQWCKDRYKPLELVCNDLKIPLKHFDNNSEFYRGSTRDEVLKNKIRGIISYIQNRDYTHIFTHNYIGEYGHLDHILIHTICKTLNKPLFQTDICIESNWLPISKYVTNDKCLFEFENDLSWYYKYEQIYRQYGVWTWNKPAIKTSKLYLV